MFKKLYHSKNFYIRSSLYGALSLGGAVASYILYPVVIRIVSRDIFGDIATSLSLASQLASIFLAFNIVSLYISKIHIDSRERLEDLQRVIVRVFLIISLVVFITSPALKQVLNFRSYSSFVALVLIMLLSVPSVIWMGYFQGKQEMARVGIYTLLSGVFKTLLAVIFALIFKNELVLFGIVIGQLLGLVVFARLPGNKVPALSSIIGTRLNSSTVDSKLRNYLASAVAVSVLMSACQNLDILFGKALLASDESGTFVAISSLSNTVFYVCSLLIWITLAGTNVTSYKESRRVLLRSCASILGIGVLAAVTAKLFESLVFDVFINGADAKFSGQLWRDIVYQTTTAGVTLYLYWQLLLAKRHVPIKALLFTVPLLGVPFLESSYAPISLIHTLIYAQVAGISLVFLLELILRLRSKYYGNKNKTID